MNGGGLAEQGSAGVPASIIRCSSGRRTNPKIASRGKLGKGLARVWLTHAEGACHIPKMRSVQEGVGVWSCLLVRRKNLDIPVTAKRGWVQPVDPQQLLMGKKQVLWVEGSRTTSAVPSD